MIAALIALATGATQALALADPWTGQAHGWLQVGGLAVLVALLLRPPPRGGSAQWRGFRLGWCFGLAWLAGTFWWLYISMHTYGGLNAALAVAAVLALAGLLALYYALAAAAFAALAARPGLRLRPGLASLLFAALWTLAELARGRWFTGFPWGAGGYAHVDGLLAAYARWVGVYGIGLAAAWLAALLALGLSPRTGPAARAARGLAPAGLIAVLMLAWGLAQTLLPVPPAPAGPRLEVALLQGNIAQDEKFIPGTGVTDALRWYGEQLQANTAPLVVAPETALPLLPRQLPEGYWAALQARYAQPGQAALLGMPLGDLQAGYTNSAVGLAPGQAAPYRYDKHHLVPFGEFIPPLFRWFVRLMNIPLGDFTAGAVNQPSFEWQGQRLAPNICYEDLFGEELAARFADPATAPTVFVNLSNIAWFGDTVAIDQHLAISRMRALEFERPVLRATNTGATVIIDAQGRVTHQLPRLTRGVLQGSFEGRHTLTPYAAWVARWGLGPLWAAAALIVLTAAAAAGRHPR
ncbi:MAG: apolipoprotein N-acyltransferase [Burkholderiaceae bacterium]